MCSCFVVVSKQVTVMWHRSQLSFSLSLKTLSSSLSYWPQPTGVSLCRWFFTFVQPRHTVARKHCVIDLPCSKSCVFVFFGHRQHRGSSSGTHMWCQSLNAGCLSTFRLPAFWAWTALSLVWWMSSYSASRTHLSVDLIGEAFSDSIGIIFPFSDFHATTFIIILCCDF